MSFENIKQALAENTAQMKVLADRYVQIWARAAREIKFERAKVNPSQWKIEALAAIQDRAEENIARFKAGPDYMEDWLHKFNRGKMIADNETDNDVAE